MFRLIDRHRVRGRGGFKTYGEEDHLLFRVLLRELHRVSGRVHNPHVAAGGLNTEQILRRTRDPQHVAERTEDDVLLRSDPEGLIDQFQRSDADRTSWAVNQRDGLWE